MKAFLVDLENKPGELARVTEAIAKKGINIEAVSGTTCDQSGRLAIVTRDDAGTRTALEEANRTFKEMEATEVSLPHAPGGLAKAARRLADASINIEAILPVGMQGQDVTVAFVTDQPAKARELLAGTAVKS
jgi:hypothetical protein